MARLPLVIKRIFVSLAALILIAGFGVPAVNTATVSAASPVNAVYVWWGGYVYLLDAQARTNFLDDLQAEGINTAYVQITVDSINFFTPGWAGVDNGYKDLITAAHQRGIEIHALIGDSGTMLTNPDAHRPYIEAIIKYNIENPGYEFDGIDWDIEPVRDKADLMTAYMQALKAISYQGETIVTQGLFLSAYLDAPQYLGTGDIAALFHQFDLINLNSYADTFDFLVTHAADGPDFCEQEGIAFTIGLETDELTVLPDMYTLFEEGQDAYHALAAQAAAYWGASYTQYEGLYVDHYERGISLWYMIENVVWAQGEHTPGQDVSATVTLRRNDSYPQSPVGLTLTIKDASGTTWEESKVVVLTGRETETVTLTWTVPQDATAGAYDMSISTWDIDLGGRNSTLYIQDFGGDEAAMEAVTLAELKAMSGLTGLRDTFILLSKTGWHNDVFTVSTGGGGSSIDPDVNGDGTANVLDLILIGQRWGEQGQSGWIGEDVNLDGVINVLDIIIVGQHWTG